MTDGAAYSVQMLCWVTLGKEKFTGAVIIAIQKCQQARS
jgi:hypothetical protein